MQMNPGLQETINGIKPVSLEWRVKARDYLNQLAEAAGVTASERKCIHEEPLTFSKQ